MNPKTLQYLMGHSDISVTLNTYTHLKLDDARDEMVNMNLLQKQAEKEMVALGQKGEEHKLIAIRKSV